jgi:uncharacterized protein (TIGR02172 family)
MEKGKLIGQGNTAEVFTWGENHIIKLYRKDVPDTGIENEFKISNIVFKKKIPTPYAKEIVEVEGRRGIVYEFVNGVTMMRYIAVKPWCIRREARRLANLHYMVHSSEALVIVDQKVRLKKRINYTELLSEDKKVIIIKYLESLDKGNSLCHGDFHPDNILISGDKAVIIDWMDGLVGNPLADVARTCLLLSMASLPENMSFIIKRIIKLARSRFYSEYIKQYLKISNANMEDVEKWFLPVAAARLVEWLPQSEKNELLRIIDEKLLFP